MARWAADEAADRNLCGFIRCVPLRANTTQREALCADARHNTKSGPGISDPWQRQIQHNPSYPG